MSAKPITTILRDRLDQQQVRLDKLEFQVNLNTDNLNSLHTLRREAPAQSLEEISAELVADRVSRTNARSDHGKVKDYNERVVKLINLRDTQCSEGNYDQGEYMRGMANALMIAVATMTDTDIPQDKFFKAPEDLVNLHDQIKLLVDTNKSLRNDNADLMNANSSLAEANRQATHPDYEELRAKIPELRNSLKVERAEVKKFIAKNDKLNETLMDLRAEKLRNGPSIGESLNGSLREAMERNVRSSSNISKAMPKAEVEEECDCPSCVFIKYRNDYRESGALEFNEENAEKIISSIIDVIKTMPRKGEGE